MKERPDVLISCQNRILDYRVKGNDNGIGKRKEKFLLVQSIRQVFSPGPIYSRLSYTRDVRTNLRL